MPSFRLIAPHGDYTVTIDDPNASGPALFGLTAAECDGAVLFLDGSRRLNKRFGSTDEGRIPVLGPKPKEERK